MDKGYSPLDIDAEFKSLIRPLRRDEHVQLEANLILDGCRDPIMIWNRIIVDGHNRYEICNRLHIPYAVQKVEFDSRNEAIVWICNNQLGRRNITEETRKYLIGRQYEAEKAVGFRRNEDGHKQYTYFSKLVKADESHAIIGKEHCESSRCTANRVGKTYQVSSGAVQKYGKYSAALDTIAEMAPDLAAQILSGSYKISYHNLLALSMMETEEVQKLSQKAQHGAMPFTRYSDSRLEFSDRLPMKPGPKVPTIPAIKTMPAFDPDAEVTGLRLTIPSWMSSIERTKVTTNLNAASLSAKQQLEQALDALQCKVQEMICALKEEV